MTSRATLDTRTWPPNSFTLSAAAQALTEAGWKVRMLGTAQLEATHGSRLLLRFAGIMFAKTRANMPVALHITAEPSTPIVAVTLANPGRYLISLNMTDLYRDNAQSALVALDRLTTSGHAS